MRRLGGEDDSKTIGFEGIRMNDFTKEELQYLLQCVIADNEIIENCGDEHNELDFSDSVENKIQSMIDNYCEHDVTQVLHKSGMYLLDFCTKCRKVKNKVTSEWYEYDNQ